MFVVSLPRLSPASWHSGHYCLPVAGSAPTITRINRHYSQKAQKHKNAGELSWRTRQLLEWRRCRQAMLLRSMAKYTYTKELEYFASQRCSKRWRCRHQPAGLKYQSSLIVTVCVEPPCLQRYSPAPDWVGTFAERDLFHPREEADHLCKTNPGRTKYTMKAR